ncbi:XRE family transcriptional regulator [Acinetobacter courvalinii]|uniref:XRE family transcriptional regulator n=1 Tax=Acinetobacter courvalinii TaxID=280147 RepID=UPI002899EBB1|nr:LexA family transcriptional regulator [Acinetobacter courvalinii]
MHPYLTKNFNYLLRKHDILASQLADLIGVSQPTLSRIEKPTKPENVNPKASTLTAIAKWADVTVDELTGKDLQEKDKQKPQRNLSQLLDHALRAGILGDDINISEIESEVYDDGNEVPEGYVAIDFYSEIKASAGSGYCNLSNSSPQKIYIPVSEAFKYGANPKTSKTFIVDGESMLPELKPGFPITIDTSAKRIVDGEIYAFLKGDELKIKFLHSWNDEGKGGFIARSSNPDKNRYPDEYYSPARIEADNIQILGQYWLKLAGTKVKR